MDVSWDKVRELATEYAVPLALRILFALFLLGFGRVIARAIVRVVDRALERNHADTSLRRFVGDILSVVMLGVVILVALDTFGVKTTAIVAVLGAAGLAIGLALQGSLSNFAAGVMLIMLRPYRVGDLVVLGKYAGRVDVIRVFHTVVITSDNRQVTIPNGQILQQPIENLTALGCRRLDLVITIGDVSELDVVARQLEAIAIEDARIERSPAPLAEVAEVNELGAKFYLRVWTRSEAYGDLAMAELVRVRGALRGTYNKFTAAVAPS